MAEIPAFSARRIWGKAPHSTFTDLVWFRNAWWPKTGRSWQPPNSTPDGIAYTQILERFRGQDIRDEYTSEDGCLPSSGEIKPAIYFSQVPLSELLQEQECR